MSRPLRLMLFDRSCRGRGLVPGLSDAWAAGGVLYRALGRIDACFGAGTWAEGLDWLVDAARARPIEEIQFWGHGEWGGAWIDEELLTAAALEPAHYLHDRLAKLRTRLVPREARWWFRSCDVFGTRAGHELARAWTRFFGCRAAGHTHQIMVLQSGLHVLASDEEPSWPCEEGVVDGLWHADDSSMFAPHTITCLHNRIPES
jgi:hypothetical protein